MVEHLSEGDINDKDKSVCTLDALKENDYYSLFKNQMANSDICKSKKSGIAVFFDIFNFNEVVTILRKMYNLQSTNEEIKTGTKFSFVLLFDKELKFLKDMTFFTESAYIRYEKKVPRVSDFREFEELFKLQLEQDFDESENNAEKFNAAILGKMEKYKIDKNQCRFQLVENIETSATNLHSFFIDDLEKAQNIDTTNLKDYLYGDIDDRVNLDSKSSSDNFNPSAFESILMPKNYPLGRFPGNTEYALSLMQQVAVNLAIGYDNKTIRSVNGPPGTGKTTLLKDIFAELIVKQSYDIAKMNDHQIIGTEETIYYNKASIGVIPENISQNSIVVASSNNAAVQNIVNELPIIEKQIDNALIEELLEADYFKEIANSTVSSKWEKDSSGRPHEEISQKPNDEGDKFWGLFSLEGGKSDNVNNILTRMKLIVKYFENKEYKPDINVYQKFLDQYKAVKEIRDRKQKIAENYCEHNKKIYDMLNRKYIFALKSYEKEKQDFEKKIQETETEIDKIYKELHELDGQLSEYDSQTKIIKHHDEQLKLIAETNGNKYIDKEIADYVITEKSRITDEMDLLKKQIDEINTRKKDLQNKSKAKSEELRELQQKYESWIVSSKKDLEDFEQTIKGLNFDETISQINALDMNRDYDKLHLSNPWFDEEYRIAQSKLFIMALKVRKQFLFENRKNIKAATTIWNRQNDYLENKQVIVAAWGWINMTIPIISSTFASFSRMCRNLGVNTMGHLFIDEAGQALPQASVGAIFRSKHVMVVGDPSQIKPVLTVDSNVLKMLGKHFEVTEKYLSDSASTQTLVDAASKYGFYREQDKTDDSWIGIPLWVHRRCQYPMFTISNQISYNGFMVQGKPENGKAAWFDVGGTANNKYVEEQGEFLLRTIKKMAEDDPGILNKNEKDKIYVITPFSNVAFHLAQKLNQRDFKFTRYKDGKPTNVGTIHTFQGKEAPIVFLVLGADPQSKGAAIWAVNEPNMMNVAATRAKEEFYVIGDKKLYLSLGSEVASETYRIISEYQAKQEATEIIQRVEGTIIHVGNGKTTKYAYVRGNNGEKYTIDETIYSQTPNADEIIQKDKSISFVPKNSQEYRYALATDIQPV